MSLTLNIILWTSSFVFATIGIIFGIIASRNSHKANIAIKELIEGSWIANEADKVFFKSLKELLSANKQVELLLEKTPSYRDYNIIATATRMSPISKRSKDVLNTTEYKNLISRYDFKKETLETMFKNIIPDFEILKTNTKIGAETVADLKEYHYIVDFYVQKIIRRYVSFLNNN